jgi:hypothetical protein
MDRRWFMQLAAGVPALAREVRPTPAYRPVTTYKPGPANSGMPGAFPGRLSSVHRADSIDPETEKVNAAAVREMMRQGMLTLTGDRDLRDAWARFVTPEDVVGIKINASGAPNINSSPEVVGEVARNLVTVGVKPENIWIYERFKSQVDTVDYAASLPKGAHVVTADSYLGYDPYTYVEVSFFGEDDTRSNLVRLVSDKLTKIINVPNMKDHGASGVTGCLKNIAYGSFGNVARSHYSSDTFTLSFIGTLASMEPLRSRTVLQVMDGLKGVWHGGPFAPDKKFRFYPARMMFGTDPVAIDRILLDVIEDKRRTEKAISVWDRSEERLKGRRDFRRDPNVNQFIREPGHIEYASGLGLGVVDKARIDMREVKM